MRDRHFLKSKKFNKRNKTIFVRGNSEFVYSNS